MLAEALKEHQQRQAAEKIYDDRLRRETENKLNALADSLAETVNVGVASAFASEQAIEAETKRLQAGIMTYQKQTKMWLGKIAEVNDALKELGDIQTWSQAIERDMKDICLVIEKVHGVGSDS
ncbi:hypothetical protein HDU85_000183 [Gaertneriomyces sp. JEL0708]|nr:hypothetical protein HDU85_000183 [Gaertneriomyces sp. JEL0708]